MLGVAAAGAAVVTEPAAAAPRSVGRWIADLDAADPAVRDGATDALSTRGGPAARAAVIAALPAASPEAAARLATVLLRTTAWDAPALDAAVRPAFGDYALQPADERGNRVAGLADVPVAEAGDALIHVLRDDPSPAVRWVAARALQRAFDPPADDEPLAAAAALAAARVLATATAPPDPTEYPPPSQNGPLLAAAAWACRTADPARADGLVRRALAIEAEHPSAFRGQADFFYQWAADRAVERGDFAAATVLFRQRAARTPWSDVELPEPVADLFAGHAEHGPFPGFADDLRLYRPYGVRPELLYCLGRMAERRGDLTGAAAAAALHAAAFAASGTSADGRRDVGRFLFQHGWSAAAERELLASLWLSGPDAPAAELADTYFALHSVADDRDDDAAAGRYLEEALKRSPRGGMTRETRYGQKIPWSDAEAWAEVHWHDLRAAVTAGDRAGALAHARQILDLDADGQVLRADPGKAADLVPVLADAGHPGEADRCFAAAYNALSKEVAEQPAEAMPKNNLAWLCARSDRHPDEADRLSAAAVALDPSDAACLDTRAEVLFRAGRVADAVASETRALSVKPDDVYMQRQLDRFRAATTRPAR